MHSLKSKKNILTFPASSLEVACPGGEVCEAGPNKVAGIGKNICSAPLGSGAWSDGLASPTKGATKMKSFSHLPEHPIVTLRCGGERSGRLLNVPYATTAAAGQHVNGAFGERTLERSWSIFVTSGVIHCVRW